MNEVITTAALRHLTGKMNPVVVERVSSRMPELSAKIAFFDRANSQVMTSMMTLTMLNGQSPMRLLRQVLAEVSSRRMALAEAQLNHIKTLREISALEASPSDPVTDAELVLKRTSLESLETGINGAMKEIACLIDAYEHIKAKHGIGDDWTEEVFDDSEKLFHVRRAFELHHAAMFRKHRRIKEVSEVGSLQQVPHLLFRLHGQVPLLRCAGNG